MISDLLGEEKELDLSDKQTRQLFIMAQLMNEVNQQNKLGFTEDVNREWEIARIIKHDSKRKRVMVEWKIGGKGCK